LNSGLLSALPLWIAAAWTMSLSMLGLWVVPMLFASLPSPALAGNMAAKLFSGQTWISVVCCLGLLLSIRHTGKDSSKDSMGASLSPWLLAGMVLALLVEFAVAPRILQRENLRLWHGLGSAMFVGQWVCSLFVFGRFSLCLSRR